MVYNENAINHDAANDSYYNVEDHILKIEERKNILENVAFCQSEKFKSAIITYAKAKKRIFANDMSDKQAGEVNILIEKAFYAMASAYIHLGIPEPSSLDNDFMQGMKEAIKAVIADEKTNARGR